MTNPGYNLEVSDELLQRTAEELHVWNFAKKARKVINALKGELPNYSGSDLEEVNQKLEPAMKYAGVAFSTKEIEAFLSLIRRD